MMASELNPSIAYTPENVIATLRQLAKTDYGVSDLHRVDDWYWCSFYPAISDTRVRTMLIKAGAEYMGQIKATDRRHETDDEYSVIKFRMRG